jgi:hypothetical protein
MGQTGDTEIANMALMLLGTATRIQNITQGGAVADAARTSLLFRPRELLEQHNWNFALVRERVTVTQVEPGLDDEYPWSIALPANCLRWIPWARDDVHYFEAEQEGRFLLVKEATAQMVRYVAAELDRTKWSALFTRALVAQVAFDLCEPIAADKGTRDRMLNELETALAQARRSDMLATGRTDRPPPDRLSRAVRAMGRSSHGDPGRNYE